MINDVPQVGAGTPVRAPLVPFEFEKEQSHPSAGEEKRRRISRQEVEAIVHELNETVKILNTKLAFSVDKATKKTVVKVIDADTNEIIRQIPAEEMMRVAARISELVGVLFDETL